MRRYILPGIGGFYVGVLALGWQFFERSLFFLGLASLVVAVIVVGARLGYNELEDRRLSKAWKRDSRTDVAELLERYSFPGDLVEDVIDRLRGIPLHLVRREVKDIDELRRRVNSTPHRGRHR